MNELSVKSIREMKAQLENVAHHGDIPLPMRADIYMTEDGVVMIGKGTFIHPSTFRDVAGEEAYQELIARPRVRSPYSKEIE